MSTQRLKEQRSCTRCGSRHVPRHMRLGARLVAVCGVCGAVLPKRKEPAA